MITSYFVDTELLSRDNKLINRDYELLSRDNNLKFRYTHTKKVGVGIILTLYDMIDWLTCALW